MRLIEACVVRIMKARKAMKHNELIIEVSSQLAGIGKAEPSSSHVNQYTPDHGSSKHTPLRRHVPSDSGHSCSRVDSGTVIASNVAAQSSSHCLPNSSLTGKILRFRTSSTTSSMSSHTPAVSWQSSAAEDPRSNSRRCSWQPGVAQHSSASDGQASSTGRSAGPNSATAATDGSAAIWCRFAAPHHQPCKSG